MSAADALPFDFLQLLGQGAQGSVHVVYNREHAEYQAVKLIAADYVTGHKKRFENLGREIVCMQRVLSHPHAVQIKFCTARPVQLQEHEYWIIAQELCIGSLAQFLQLAHAASAPEVHKHDSILPFAEEHCIVYGLQLLSVLAHCHDNGVFHRDIKPDNILIDVDLNLRLGDFGLARTEGSAESASDEWFTTFCGTQNMMAPEVRAREPYDGACADVWSVGIVLFWMRTGTYPWAEATASDPLANLVREGKWAEFWENHAARAPWGRFSSRFKEFLQATWKWSPSERASVHELSKADLFSSISADMVAAVLEDMRRRQANSEAYKCMAVRVREHDRLLAEGAMLRDSSCHFADVSSRSLHAAGSGGVGIHDLPEFPDDLDDLGAGCGRARTESTDFNGSALPPHPYFTRAWRCVMTTLPAESTYNACAQILMSCTCSDIDRQPATASLFAKAAINSHAQQTVTLRVYAVPAANTPSWYTAAGGVATAVVVTASDETLQHDVVYQLRQRLPLDGIDRDLLESSGAGVHLRPALLADGDLLSIKKLQF